MNRRDKQIAAVRALVAGACACGEPKRVNQAFCPLCYRRLPADVRRGLWAKLGKGFAGVYHVALEILKEKGRIKGAA